MHPASHIRLARLITIFAGFAPVFVWAEPPAASVLPRETLAYASVENMARFREAWEGSSFGAMQRDPELQPFLEDITDQLETLAATVGVPLDSAQALANQLQGGAAIALVKTNEGRLSPVIVADLGDDPEQRERIVRRFEELLRSQGGEATTIEASGRNVSTWELGGRSAVRKLAHAVEDGQLVIGDSLGTVLEITNASPGSDDRLSDRDEFREFSEQTSSAGNAGVRWYVDPVGIVTAATSGAFERTGRAGFAEQALAVSGLDGLKFVGGTVALGTGQFDSVTWTFGHVEEPVRGLLNALALPATPQQPPDWVSEDVSLYAQINWSGDRFYQAISGFYDRFQGPGSFDAAVGGMKLDEETTLKEFSQQLVGPIHVAADIPVNVRDLVSQPSVIAVGVKDPETVERLLRAWRDNLPPDQKVESREIAGAQMYSLEMSGVVPEQSLNVAAAVAEGSLMLSTDAGYLEGVLRGRQNARPLAEASEYREVADDFPERTSVIVYQRQSDDYEQLYERLRSGTVVEGLPGSLSLLSGLDYSRLPPFRVMRKYLQNTGGYIAPTEEGFEWVNFALPPRER